MAGKSWTPIPSSYISLRMPVLVGLWFVPPYAQQ